MDIAFARYAFSLSAENRMTCSLIAPPEWAELGKATLIGID